MRDLDFSLYFNFCFLEFLVFYLIILMKRLKKKKGSGGSMHKLTFIFFFVFLSGRLKGTFCEACGVKSLKKGKIVWCAK